MIRSVNQFEYGFFIKALSFYEKSHTNNINYGCTVHVHLHHVLLRKPFSEDYRLTTSADLRCGYSYSIHDVYM